MARKACPRSPCRKSLISNMMRTHVDALEAPRMGRAGRLRAARVPALGRARGRTAGAALRRLRHLVLLHRSSRDRKKSGLLFKNPYDGYRSYFVPLFIAVVARLAVRWRIRRRHGGAFTATACPSCSGSSPSALMAWLARTRRARRTFLQRRPPRCSTPFLLVYVPFALQEGVLMAWCLPLLFVWVGAKDRAAGSAPRS